MWGAFSCKKSCFLDLHILLMFTLLFHLQCRSLRCHTYLHDTHNFILIMCTDVISLNLTMISKLLYKLQDKIYTEVSRKPFYISVKVSFQPTKAPLSVEYSTMRKLSYLASLVELIKCNTVFYSMARYMFLNCSSMTRRYTLWSLKVCFQGNIINLQYW